MVRGSHGALSESTPLHALGASHTADIHVGVRLVLVLNLDGRLGSTLRTGMRLSDATCTGVAKLLDDLPVLVAGIASFADGAFGMVARILVQWHRFSKVIEAHNITTAPTVMATEVPAKWLAADGACGGRLIRLFSETISFGSLKWHMR